MGRILTNKLKQNTRLFVFLMLCAFSAAKQYDEGDFCDFSDYNGTCLRVTKCLNLPVVAQTLGLKREQIGHCGFSVTEEIICCPILHKNVSRVPRVDENEIIYFIFNGARNATINNYLTSGNENHVLTAKVGQRMQEIPIENNDVPNNAGNNGESRAVEDSSEETAQVPLSATGKVVGIGNIPLPVNVNAYTPCKTRHYNGICKAKLQCRHLAVTLVDMGLNDTDVTLCDHEYIICCPNIERPAVRACRAIESELEPYQEEHIFGGHKVSAKEYPFMAYIVYDQPDFVCGGTLIHERFVLTAAHCVVQHAVKAIKVTLGIANLYDSREARYRQDIDIKRTIDHEKYSSLSNYYDIAVIELAKEVKRGLTVYPTCLHTDRTELPDDIELTTAGWGITENKSLSEHLLAVQLKKTPLSKCIQSYAQYIGRYMNHGIADTQLCALAPGKDSCLGDSGGPLLLSENAAYNNYRVVGITSFGSTCGQTVPGVYTRVSKFLDFVEAIVWPDEYFKYISLTT